MLFRSYNVKLTVSDGAHTKSLTRKNNISVNVCTGYQEPQASQFFKAFPNPAHDKIWIEPNSDMSGESKFTLYDLFGRLVRVKEVSQGITPKLIELNLTGLPKGIYFLRMQADGLTGVQKLVVE